MDTDSVNFNLASRGTDLQKEVLFANFNQDCNALAIATKERYCIYALSNIEKIELLYDNTETDTEVCLFDRFFSTALVVFTSLKSPKKLKVCNFMKEKNRKEIRNLHYSNSILALKFNRSQLIVLLENSIFILNIVDLKTLHTIRDTPSNLRGLCCISCNNKNPYFAYPGSSVSGEVQLFDLTKMRNLGIIKAHDSPLAAMNFDFTAEIIATASEKGTVIRVFSVPDGQKLCEFRRGSMRCASIGTLAFSPDSSLLLVSSNTETIHIFHVDDEISRIQQESEQPSWTSWLTSFTPTVVSNAVHQARDYATIRLPFSNLRNVCAFTTIQDDLYVVVVNDTGHLYIYNLPSESGECSLSQQHQLQVGASTSIESPQVQHSVENGTVVFRDDNSDES